MADPSSRRPASTQRPAGLGPSQAAWWRAWLWVAAHGGPTRAWRRALSGLRRQAFGSPLSPGGGSEVSRETASWRRRVRWVQTLAAAGVSARRVSPADVAVLTGCTAGDSGAWLEAVLDAGMETDAGADDRGATLLALAVRHDHPDAIRRLLARGASPYGGPETQQPWRLLLQRRPERPEQHRHQLELAGLFLEAGADSNRLFFPDHRAEKADPPLAFAGTVELAERLLDHGADPNAPFAPLGQTADRPVWQHLLGQTLNPRIFRSLWRACKQAGALPDHACSKGRTFVHHLVHRLAYAHHSESIRLSEAPIEARELLAEWANGQPDWWAQDRWGNTALHLSAVRYPDEAMPGFSGTHLNLHVALLQVQHACPVTLSASLASASPQLILPPSSVTLAAFLEHAGTAGCLTRNHRGETALEVAQRRCQQAQHVEGLSEPDRQAWERWVEQLGAATAAAQLARSLSGIRECEVTPEANPRTNTPQERPRPRL